MSVDKKAIQVNKAGEVIFARAIIEANLQDPTLWFAETLTGAATYGKKDLILAGGQLVQAAIKRDFWGEFLRQLHIARKKGRIKDKFYDTRHGRINFNELFTYLDNNKTVDDEVFKAMQAIFFASEEVASEHKHEIVAYELLQLAKRMKSVDLLVLKAAYGLYLRQKKGDSLGIQTVQDWQVNISEKIGLPIDMVVDSRIKFSGTSEGTYPRLFSVNDSYDAMGVINMRLNASSITLSQFIEKGESVLSK